MLVSLENPNVKIFGTGLDNISGELLCVEGEIGLGQQGSVRYFPRYCPQEKTPRLIFGVQCPLALHSSHFLWIIQFLLCDVEVHFLVHC